jgi:CheY-like chemotaxis protein
MTDKRLPAILLVDDEEADRMMFERIAASLKFDLPILTARDGAEALEVIREETVREDATRRPIVIVTDINMPGLSGHDLIDQLRSDPQHANAIIFVLTSSDLPYDKQRAYQNRVAGYMVKDTAGMTMQQGIRMLSHYCSAVTMPH